MTRTPEQLRDDALAIWRAGVQAVDSEQLVRDHVRLEGSQLLVVGRRFDLSQARRIVVVGAGKAGAGMSAALADLLDDPALAGCEVAGWVNVPADCVRTLPRIVLHPARPAGINEPTEAGVDGTRRILELVDTLEPDDLCICLLSGGGSALLPMPIDGITLADKQAVTKLLSGAGANIEELNTVRKQLSRIKGGGLARSCRATLVTLIISDVIGDPLDVIASGPTVANSTTAADALAVLQRIVPDRADVPAAVWEVLEQRAGKRDRHEPLSHVHHVVIGNNATAVRAAAKEAARRGFQVEQVAAESLEGQAEAVGEQLAEQAVRMRSGGGVDCLVTGGEPVVQLAPADRRGKGGRNQQLVLAALVQLLQGQPKTANPLTGMVVMAGGTDGEDGPTDAAGAFIDAAVVEKQFRRQLDPPSYLANNDAYHFFQQVDSLVKTGPTHTNVCDLRVVLVNRDDA